MQIHKNQIKGKPKAIFQEGAVNSRFSALNTLFTIHLGNFRNS